MFVKNGFGEYEVPGTRDTHGRHPGRGLTKRVIYGSTIVQYYKTRHFDRRNIILLHSVVFYSRIEFCIEEVLQVA